MKTTESQKDLESTLFLGGNYPGGNVGIASQGVLAILSVSHSLQSASRNDNTATYNVLVISKKIERPMANRNIDLALSNIVPDILRSIDIINTVKLCPEFDVFPSLS